MNPVYPPNFPEDPKSGFFLYDIRDGSFHSFSWTERGAKILRTRNNKDHEYYFKENTAPYAYMSVAEYFTVYPYKEGGVWPKW
jgi:hypothetical protein